MSPARASVRLPRRRPSAIASVERMRRERLRASRRIRLRCARRDVDEARPAELEDLHRQLEARHARREALVEAQVAAHELGMVVAVEVGDAVALAPVAVDLAVRAGRRIAPQDRRLERAARREAVGAVDEHLGLAVAVEVREAQLGEARPGRVVRARSRSGTGGARR